MIYCTVCPVAELDDMTDGELPRGMVMNVCVTLAPGSELFGVREMKVCPLPLEASAAAEALVRGTWRVTVAPGGRGNPGRGCTGMA